jgi:hypothetical protein
LNEKLKSTVAIAIAIPFFFTIAIIFFSIGSISITLIYIVLAISGVSYLAYFVVINIPKPYHDIEGAAYLAPWYFKDDTPRIIKNSESLKWRYIEKIGDDYAGVLVLEDRSGNCFAILKTYTYFLPFASAAKFLIWNRHLTKKLPQELEIFLFDAASLKAIENTEKKILELKDCDAAFLISAEPSSTLKFRINPTEESLQLKFPDAFKAMDEFIIVTHLENLYENPEKKYWDNTAVMVFKPKQDFVFIYPQDWFNKAEHDFGYEWITRVARDAESGYIRGEGIRIRAFILDGTNRQIKKYLKN